MSSFVHRFTKYDGRYTMDDIRIQGLLTIMGIACYGRAGNGGSQEAVMKETGERKTGSLRHPSNIIFNLVALALLLTVIVFLHQILKKPKQAQEQKPTQEVKSVAALPAKPATPEPAPQAVAAPPPVQVTLPSPVIVPVPAETVVELPAKEPEARPVTQKRAKRVSVLAEQETSPAELDGDEARKKYLEENRRLSSGKVKIAKSQTKSPQVISSPAKSDLDREAARRFEPRSNYDLDDEAARQKYLEENKRLSRLVGTDEKQNRQAPAKKGPSGSDEYIPFEDR